MQRVRRLLTCGFFVLCDYAVRSTGISALPPPLVGLLTLFGVLLLLESVGMAQPLYRLLEPGYRFLVKWAMLFFIPALVKLPLVEERFSKGVMLRLFVLLTVGFTMQCVFTAAVASLFPPLPVEKKPANNVKLLEEGGVEPYPRPTRPYKRRFLSGYTVLMTLALVAYRCNLAPGFAETMFMLCAMLLGFVSGQNAPAKVKIVLHPILACLLGSWLGAAVWAKFAGPEVSFHDVLSHYAAASGAGSLVSMLMGPLVVALALMLYERRELLYRDMRPILTTCAAAAAFGLFGTAVLARLLAVPQRLAVAAVPRCITAPLALGIAGLLDASPAFTVPMVVITGFLGATLGAGLLNALRFKTARSRGLALGASSHALGAASLALSEPQAFPYGGLAFVLVGGASAALVAIPPVRSLLLGIVG